MYGPNQGNYADQSNVTFVSDGFSSFLKTLFTSRHIASELFSYVYMPAENDLIGHIEGIIAETCVVSGAKGVGKSTLLSHVKHIYLNKERYVVIKIDFNPTRKIIAEGIPGRLATHILDSVDSYMKKTKYGIIDTDEKIAELYDYIKKNHGKFLKELDVEPLYPTNIQERKEALASLSKKDQFRYAIASLGFLATKTNINKVLLIVDNVDHYSADFIKKLYDIISRMTVCIDRDTNSNLSIVPILACRDYIHKEVFLNDRGRGAATQFYGFQDVIIDGPCLLPDLLEERIKRIEERAQDLYYKDNGPIISNNGFKWDIEDRDRFLRNLITLIRANQHHEGLRKLCNNDMSEMLNQFYIRIIRNDIFINPDEIIGPESSVEGLKQKVPWHMFLNCLAYGNPVNGKRCYPCEGSLVPNLLRWNSNKKYSIFSRFRVLQFINMCESIEEKSCINIITKLMIPYLGFGDGMTSDYSEGDGDQALTYLKKMCSEGLIFSYEGESISNQNDFVVDTIKSKSLMNILTNQSLLLEYYFDDTCRDSRSNKERNTLHSYPREIRPTKIINFLEFIANKEYSQLRNIDQNINELNQFLSLVGRESIAGMFLKGVQNSFDKLYDREQSGKYGIYLAPVENVVSEIESLLRLET